jgi:hypothetical protein
MCISDGAVPAIRGQLSYTENGNPFTVDVVQMEVPADLVASQPAGNTTAGQSQTTTTDSSATAAQGNAQSSDSTTQNAQVAANGSVSGVNQVTPVSNDSVITNNTAVNTTINTGNNQQSTNVDVVPAGNGNQKQDLVAKTNSDKTENKTVENEIEVVTSVDNGTIRAVVNTLPSAEKGITYKVQILAAHRVVDKSYLKKKFSFEEDYNIENHNGWIKYTTGMYAQYKDARDARVRITNASSKLPGPFVTAYNDGERITVQEALLVSKQLWYK